MANVIYWFEIPVNDLERAEIFYSQIFSVQMEKMDFGEIMKTFIIHTHPE